MLYELVKERKVRGLTQKDMADLLGVVPITYFRKENGKVDFTDAEKLKILELFDLPKGKINIFFEKQLTQKVKKEEGK